jgi:hypothetical protein
VNDKTIFLFLSTKKSPHATSKAATVATIATANPLLKTSSRFAAPVALTIADTRMMKPVNEANPPKAILSRWVAEKTGIDHQVGVQQS